MRKRGRCFVILVSGLPNLLKTEIWASLVGKVSREEWFRDSKGYQGFYWDKMGIVVSKVPFILPWLIEAQFVGVKCDPLTKEKWSKPIIWIFITALIWVLLDLVILCSVDTTGSLLLSEGKQSTRESMGERRWGLREGEEREAGVGMYYMSKEFKKKLKKKQKRRRNGLLSAFRKDCSLFIGRLTRRTCHATPGSPPSPCHGGFLCRHILMEVHEACTT